MVKIKVVFRLISIFFLTSICLSCGDISITVTETDTENTIRTYEIIFYSGRSGNNEIYKINDDGDNLVNLSNHLADDTCPAVSPDGEKVAFVSDRDGVENIYVMFVSGGEAVKVTDSATNVTHPAWSPDGLQLTYIVDFNEYTEIWVVDADGSNPIRLTDNPYRDERPCFSPTMDKILFMSNRDGRYQIYLMDPDGSNQSKIDIVGVDDVFGHFVFPQWHPEGNRIIYSLNDLSNHHASIHIVDLDGSNDVALTEEDGRNEDPSWTSDGQWIVFQSERDGNFEIYKMKSDGSESQRLTNHLAWDGWPSWAN